MIANDLKNILENNQSGSNVSYTRSLLKEALQNYVLNFVYNNPVYQKLIFTGGTALRKIYGLPRLSEDLDFNFVGKFDIGGFARDVGQYFAKELSYPRMTTKISNNQRTVFLKFPLAFGQSETLFLRCDFAPQKTKKAGTEVSSITTGNFTVFVLAYDLPTLFTNKITAFLERVYFKGGEQSMPFKGRDLFDIVWFLERSKRENWSLKPKVLDSKKALAEILAKVEKISEADVYRDLAPFIESSQELDNFVKSFKEIIKNNLKFVL